MLEALVPYKAHSCVPTANLPLCLGTETRKLSTPFADMQYDAMRNQIRCKEYAIPDLRVPGISLTVAKVALASLRTGTGICWLFHLNDK